MNAIVEKPRNTTPRVEAERAKRRRRDDIGDGRMRNLAIAGTLDPAYSYRWINDDPGRVHQLTVADDWDIVTTDSIGGEAHDRDKNVGTGIERIVDKRSGKRAVLVRKLKEYVAADRAKAQAAIDETERGLRQGQVKSPEALSGPAAYVPAGGINITSGNKT